MLLSRLLLLAATASAVIILPGSGDPKPYAGPAGVTSEDAFFRESAPNEFFNNTARLILTSISAAGRNLSSVAAPGLRPSGDSFVRGAIQAWGEHLHLVVRPEEVWFTILAQLNFYMVAHAEEIRHLFVDHAGQEEIYVEDFTWYAILRRFQDEIQARVKTPWLRDWVVPDFSTTTDSDVVTASVLMMGLTKAYFRFSGKQVCELPSVTLLGERRDWERLLARLDRLPAFGAEPAAYAARLRPVLSRFVRSFDAPDAPDTRRFWNQIVSARAAHVCGDPPVFVSGWITGFYYWNPNGGPYARTTTTAGAGSGRLQPMLTLDGVAYPVLDMTTAPVGYAKAPFIMRDWAGMDEFPAYVAAGTLGKQITAGPPAGYREALQRAGQDAGLAVDEAQHATLQPLSGWMLYGPVDHNATRTVWLQEDELVDVQFSVMRFMTGETCGLLDAPAP